MNKSFEKDQTPFEEQQREEGELSTSSGSMGSNGGGGGGGGGAAAQPFVGYRLTPNGRRLCMHGIYHLRQLISIINGLTQNNLSVVAGRNNALGELQRLVTYQPGPKERFPDNGDYIEVQMLSDSLDELRTALGHKERNVNIGAAFAGTYAPDAYRQQNDIQKRIIALITRIREYCNDFNNWLDRATFEDPNRGYVAEVIFAAAV